jgi:hypothetical protein
MTDTIHTGSEHAKPLCLASNDRLGLLVACPFCGCSGGYRLHEGSTYRWWAVHCHDCARLVDECSSDRRTQRGLALPKRWAHADEVWNEAGRHAQQLREALQAMVDCSHTMDVRCCARASQLAASALLPASAVLGAGGGGGGGGKNTAYYVHDLCQNR